MKTGRILLIVGVLISGVFVAWRVALWRQVSGFSSLTSAMRAEDVVKACGRPVKTDGSGFLFLHYRLLDGSEVVVVCGSELRVISVTRNGAPLITSPT